MIRYSAVLVFAALLNFGNCAKLPSSFPICKRNDPDLGSCFSKAAEASLALMKNGVPELQLPALEPIEVEAVEISTGSGNFKVEQKLTNIKVYHVIESTVNKTDIQLDGDKFKVVIYAYAPLFKIESDYDFKGQVLQLPLVGNGKSHTDIMGINSIVTMEGDIIDKKGNKYIKLSDLSVKVEPTAVNFNFENLFNGDHRLGDEMNRLLNENWKSIYDDVRGAYESVLDVFLKKIADTLFKKVPFDDLFPL